MATFIQAVNEDANGVKTTGEYGDPGDGVDKWFDTTKVVDGGDVAQGLKADTAVDDPTAAATVIALLKGLLLGGATSTAATTALSTSLVVKAEAGRLRGIVGYSTTAQYIQVHDAVSLPADTSVPLVTIPITAGEPYSIDFGVGLECATGIVISNSTTGPTKTIGAVDTWITAIYH